MSLWAVDLPLAWPCIVTGLVLVLFLRAAWRRLASRADGWRFHSPAVIPVPIAIAIYDRVQAFDTFSAGVMSALLLAISAVTLGAVYAFTETGLTTVLGCTRPS